MGTLDATALRQQRGQAIAEVSRIIKRGGCWEVPSQRSGGGKYFVFLDPPRCSCPDFEKRGQPCKHVHAVEAVVRRESDTAEVEAIPAEPVATIPLTPEVTKRTCAERKTYKQVWPAYNRAQTTEKARFQVLLADLCRGVPDPPRKPGPGRKPVPLADAVFACAFKTYSTFSGRRFQTDLDAAQASGFLSRGIRYNTVFDAFENPVLTPILETLIVRSAIPLKAIETDFANDSTGFCTSRFVRWFDHKYGVVLQKYDWFKFHLMCSVRTNVVTAAVIGGRYSGDSPEFKPLLTTTARNFTVREVSADSAFASLENFEAVGALGGTPYIAFKSNATGEVGGLFEKMFHVYSLNRDKYLSHYHKRSNVESTASMVKAKFGDHLRSRTDTAMINEALCKVLCHNLCVLIQSQYELGIAPLFWGEEPTEAAIGESVPDETPIEAWAWV